MEKLLKGNYELAPSSKGEREADVKPDNDNAGERFASVFENSALEKLGGSIAFVMKGNQFIWEEDDEAADQ